MPVKVSICIPAYLSPDFLQRTLHSIALQSYKDYEVIVTDDSLDDTVQKVVESFGESLSIKYHHNTVPQGSPQNWNACIDLAHGEYIKIMHHDDWFSNQESLADFVAMLDDNPAADIAFSAALSCDEGQNINSTHRPTPDQLSCLRQSPSYLFPANIIGAPSSTIYRRRSHIPFDAKLKWVVDIDFYIQILLRNDEFAFCEKPLVCVTSGAQHQVTRQCEDNKDVEIYEWIYLYKKLRAAGIIGFKQLNFIRVLLRKYRVNSLKELKAYNVESPLPWEIGLVWFLQKCVTANYRL